MRRIYLSKDTIRHLIESIDLGSCESRGESDALESIKGDLYWADEHRKSNGDLLIGSITFDWIICKLDCIAAEYFNHESEWREWRAK